MKSIKKAFKSSSKSDKANKSFTRQTSVPGELPFKPTIRLQINLPHNQLMVLRILPDTILSEIKQTICNEKSFDAGKYLLVKPFKSGQTPLVLDLDKPLSFYHINEVTVLSNKNYQELSKQFSTSNCNQFTSSMYDEDSNRLGGQVDLSQSTPNIANGMFKRSVSLAESQCDKDDTSSIRTARSYKRKPAPPPPLKSAKSMQNLAPIRDEEEQRPSSEVYSSYEHHDSSSLSEHSTTTEASKVPPERVVTTQPSKNLHHRLSRQNSGSDSSGYHEMLSHTETDTPANSPAPPVSLSPNPSEASSSLVSNKPPPVPSQRTSLSTKLPEKRNKTEDPKSRGSITSVSSSGGSNKKRRAPPPPATVPPSVTQDSTQSPDEKSSSEPSSPQIVESKCTDEPSSSRLSISSEEASSSLSGTSPSSSSQALDDSKMSSLVSSDQSLSPIVAIKSSLSTDNNKSIDEDIDESIKPIMNSTMIPPTQPQSETELKLEIVPEVIETKDEPKVEHESTKSPEPTAALQVSEEKKVVSPEVKPVEQPKVKNDQIEKQSPVDPDQKKTTEQPATDELATEHKSSVVPSEQCTTNDTMIQQHLGEQPEETEGLHVQVVQPKPRVSTLGHDREASAGEKSEEIVDEEKQPKEHQHQFHSHEEGDVCACEHFTANYTRIRSQFSKFEANKSDITSKEADVATSKKPEPQLEGDKESRQSIIKVVATSAEEPSIVHVSSSKADIDSLSPTKEAELDVQEVTVDFANQDPEEEDDEMNGSLKRPSVVTISEWKTAPKDNELLLRQPNGVNQNGSAVNGNVSRSNSTLDRNLQKQIEVTLNELNDTLDGLDTSITPPSIRKKLPPVSVTPVAKSNQITVENGKSKININSNNVPNGERKVTPPKVQNESATSTKVSIGSMKDLPSVVSSVISNENVSITPMKSVRDNIAKFSVSSNLRNNNLGTSKTNYSMSHQDLTSLNRSLPNTPAGSLARRSSSKVGANPAAINGVIPEAESPQVSRKLANFRIGSFKKELDIYETPKSPLKERQKPILTTGQWKSEPSSTSALSNSPAPAPSTINNLSYGKPSQPNGDVAKPKPSPTVIAVNGGASAVSAMPTKSVPTKSAHNFALPKETAKKVFNASSATSGGANQNGERSFLQELKSRTWSHRTGLSTFDEEETTVAPPNVNATSESPKASSLANNSSKRPNLARQPDLYASNKQQPLPVSNGTVNKPTNVADQRQVEPKVVSMNTSVPAPPPPPPPPPPSNGQIDMALASRPLSPELKQTNALLAPKGWKSVKVANEQPKQIRSPLRSNSLNPSANGNGHGPKSPSSPVDQHDALLNEIRNFQNRSKLKQVANNESFTLAVNNSVR